MPLVAGRYPPKQNEWLFDGQPSSPYRISFPRLDITSDSTTALTTQVMTSVAVPLQAGDVITSIAVKSGATAAGTPTNYWFALYSNAAIPALLAQTADQSSAAWAANTTKDLALTTAQTITQTDIYYVAIMVKATTVPSLLVNNLALAGASAGLLSGQKTLCQTSGSALTTTAPATIASPTATALWPYVICH